MLKKASLLLLFGILLILSGLIIFNPEVIARIITDGKIESDRTLIILQTARIYAIITGILIVTLYLLLKLLRKELTTKIFLFSLIILGIAFAITGLYLTPDYLKTNFSRYDFLDQSTSEFLIFFQLLLTGSGLILSALAIFISIIKYSQHTILYSAVLSFFFVLFCTVAIYKIYVVVKYPSNILTQFSEYHKFYDLALGRDILLSNYEPESTLKVRHKKIKKAKYPVIDTHFHFASILQTSEDKKVLAPESLIKTMDILGITTIVNLDDDANLEAMLNRYAKKFPEKFINFMPFKFTGVKTDEWFAKRPELFENGVKQGARGLKVIKALGLKTWDPTGKLIGPDDPKLDPLWEKVSDLGLPVLWHLADPTPFFKPIDNYNERYTEMCRHPEWSFYGPGFPPKEKVLKQRENVLKKHPKLIVIGAHMGGCADDLEYLAYMLDKYPNFYVEISSTLVDLGKQPFTARKFFIKYQDRILFGSDGGVLYNQKGWTLEKFYQTYFEFLETENEYMDYPMKGVVNQGMSQIYGLNLPDQVLEKIYHKNAEKIIVGNNAIIPSSIQSNLAHLN